MSEHGFAALFFVTTVAIFAQVERASVIGNVTDATGAVAPSVTCATHRNDPAQSAAFPYLVRTALTTTNPSILESKWHSRKLGRNSSR